MAKEKRVDRAALWTNQEFIMGLLFLGFFLDFVLLWSWAKWLVPFVGAVMLAGTFWPQAALFKQIYFQILKPRGWRKPQVIPDDPTPHQFAQFLGGIVLGIGTLGFAFSLPVVGWGAAWVVIVLAGINRFLGFCVGCFIWYQLARLGIRIPMPV